MEQKTINNGKIFFFSGPSGVGKGTLINKFREKYPEWVFPPSCTTRDPRPKEVEGQTYFFLTEESFRQKIESGDFLEYAEVHGKCFYGTLKEKIMNPYQNGKVVIREFDTQGFTEARKKLPRESYISIFLWPKEGIQILKERIKERAPISDEELARRIESAKQEKISSEIYDHIIEVENGNFKKLLTAVEAIIFDAL